MHVLGDATSSGVLARAETQTSPTLKVRTSADPTRRARIYEEILCTQMRADVHRCVCVCHFSFTVCTGQKTTNKYKK